MAIRDSKTVTIHLKVSESTVARVGQGLDIDVVHKKESIGSAYTKGGSILRGLTKDEEKKYLPGIIGVSATAPEWEKECRDYWANIKVDVSPPMLDDNGKLRGGGRVLEVGFMYDSEEDAEKGRVEAEKEAKRYEAWKNGQVNKLPSNIRRFKENFEVRQSVGYPISIEDFILYRYCLNYPVVALSKDLMHNSAKIRFYIEDSQTEVKARHAFMKARNDAFAAFATTLGDRQKVKRILEVMHKEADQIREETSEEYSLATVEECDLLLEQLCKKYPLNFVNVANDSQLIVKASIEKCITAGILRRYPNTDTIVYGDNIVLGNSLQEAANFLEDEKNLEIRNQIGAKLKTVKQG